MEALFQKCLLSSPLIMSFYRIPPKKARIIIQGLSCHNDSMGLPCKMRSRRKGLGIKGTASHSPERIRQTLTLTTYNAADMCRTQRKLRPQDVRKRIKIEKKPLKATKSAGKIRQIFDYGIPRRRVPLPPWKRGRSASTLFLFGAVGMTATSYAVSVVLLLSICLQTVANWQGYGLTVITVRLDTLKGGLAP